MYVLPQKKFFGDSDVVYLRRDVISAFLHDFHRVSLSLLPVSMKKKHLYEAHFAYL